MTDRISENGEKSSSSVNIFHKNKYNEFWKGKFSKKRKIRGLGGNTKTAKANLAGFAMQFYRSTKIIAAKISFKFLAFTNIHSEKQP